ncbi:sulfite exporter TauE/SafE family protein [Micromonospora sp. CPCC 206060]|uniref:sulfite exporter TauE/SafE family protein n=1 Tax=Micromonospora sp. CPCC 206060 TaxID=3122406 RepID=UPI002FF07764
MSSLLTTFGIVLLAAVAQAVSGFGFALVAVPLLAVTTDARTAVVATSLASLALTLITMAREWRYVRWRTAGLLTGTAVLGMPVGLLILVVTPDRLLTALIAVVVLGCAMLVWSGVRMRTGRPAVGAVGVLVGVLTTATGANGPPLVAAFHSFGYDPRTFRATLAAIFTGSGAIGIVGFLAAGQVDAGTLRIAVLGLPAVALGWWLGNRVFARVGPATFRRITLVGLTASAGAAIVQSLTG